MRVGVGCAAATVTGAALAGACTAGSTTASIPVPALEQALCHKLLACSCGEGLQAVGFVPPLSCEGWRIASLVPGIELGRGDLDDTRVDQACIERIAARIDAQSCELSFTRGGCEDDCAPFFGHKLEFQACDFPYDCARGLGCVLGICRDPCSVAPPREGEPCEDSCADDLVCDRDGDGTCHRPSEAGPNCDGSTCAADAFCDLNDPAGPRCAPLRELDAPCRGHRECVDGYCPAGFCAEPPGAGQPCGLGVLCAAGSVCQGDDDGGGLCVATAPVCRSMVDAVFEQLSAHVPGYDYGGY